MSLLFTRALALTPLRTANAGSFVLSRPSWASKYISTHTASFNNTENSTPAEATPAAEQTTAAQAQTAPSSEKKPFVPSRRNLSSRGSGPQFSNLNKSRVPQGDRRPPSAITPSKYVIYASSSRTLTQGDVTRYFQNAGLEVVKAQHSYAREDYLPTGKWFVELGKELDAEANAKLKQSTIGTSMGKVILATENKYKELLQHKTFLEHPGKTVAFQGCNPALMLSLVGKFLDGFKTIPGSSVSIPALNRTLIAFESEEEAHRAVRELHCNLVIYRPVYLSVLQ